jgi:poly-beta-1,6-N-acetyl-D-glucosamine synthase
MATRMDHDVAAHQIDEHNEVGDERITCSVGIMVYNEEANIGHALHAVLKQQGPSLCVKEVVVVASGCTDRTVSIVAEIALQEPRTRLCIQEKREGKASAINLLLKEVTSEIFILMSADVLPEE